MAFVRRTRLSAILLLAACSPELPSNDAEPRTTSADLLRCSIEALDDATVPVDYETIGRVGQYTFYAEPRGLACSEPAGLSGDCEFVAGDKSILVRDGSRLLAVKPLILPTYLVYGPDRLACVAPPR